MMMRSKYLLSILFASLFCLPMWGQKQVRDLTRSGNKLYRSKEYSKAEIDYRKALEVNKSDPTTIFNLANVLYRTDRGEEAGKLYQSLAPHLSLLSSTEAADLTHNAGNTAFRAKQLEQAIEYYKESLRRRPSDEDTRYNLALAQKLLEDQKKNGGGGQDQKQDQDKDQKKDQQQDQQKDQKKDQQQQPQQPNQDQMSQETANRILQALQKDEKNTRQKLEQTQQQRGRSRRKNW